MRTFQKTIAIAFLFLIPLITLAAPTPETFFRSCLQDPLMREFSRLKADQSQGANALAGSLYIPKINVRTIVAPIEGKKGGPLAYSNDKWGPYWSFKAQAAWVFFYFGAEGLVREAKDKFMDWLRHSEKNKTNLLLQTLTEGYIQKGFLYVVRRDLRTFLRHLKGKRKFSGLITSPEVAYATLKQLDSEMKKNEDALQSLLTDVCPSMRDEFADPVGFWNSFYEDWYTHMTEQVNTSWPSIDQFVARSDTLLEYESELKAIQGEQALASRPKLFVGALLDGSVAPNRAPTYNPYLNNTYNDISAGAGVGLDWQFDLTPIRAQQLKAKLLQEKLLLSSQLERKTYFDLTALKESLTDRKTGIDHDKKRLDQAMEQLLFHAKQDSLDQLDQKRFDDLSAFYKHLHETAIAFTRDLTHLYFKQ